MTSRPRLTLQTSDVPALPAGQPLSEELVATVRNQFPQQSYAEINRFVSDWQQQTAAPVTVRQTTTTTNEIVLPAPQQPPPPRFTSEQLAASFATFRPLVARAVVPPVDPVLPGHFVKEETPISSSSSEIEVVRCPASPPIVPQNTKPSGFAMPKRTPVSMPRQEPPTFPLSRFNGWMKSSAMRDELLGELTKNESPAITIVNSYRTIYKQIDETCYIHKEVDSLVTDFNEFKKLGDRIEKRLTDIQTHIARSEDSQFQHLRLVASQFPHTDIMKDAPVFFQKRDDWTIPSSSDHVSTQPLTQEDYRHLPQEQQQLFFNQGALRYALWNEGKQRFDSTYRPRDKYHNYICKLCHLYGHIMFDCPRYECPRCKTNCGHKPTTCDNPQRQTNLIIMMASIDDSMTPLIARLSEPEPVEQSPLSQDDSHLEVTFISLQHNVETYVKALTDKELEDQLIKYSWCPSWDFVVPNDFYIPALENEWTRRYKQLHPRRDDNPANNLKNQTDDAYFGYLSDFFALYRPTEEQLMEYE